MFSVTLDGKVIQKARRNDRCCKAKW